MDVSCFRTELFICMWHSVHVVTFCRLHNECRVHLMMIQFKSDILRTFIAIPMKWCRFSVIKRFETWIASFLGKSFTNLEISQIHCVFLSFLADTHLNATKCVQVNWTFATGGSYSFSEDNQNRKILLDLFIQPILPKAKIFLINRSPYCNTEISNCSTRPYWHD